MAFKTIRGTPGDAWVNDTSRVMWQLKVKFQNSCGLCIQYANAIAGYWPIPFHPNCNCTQHPVRPGQTADPFVDFQEELRKLGPDQQRIAVGATNWKLIEAGTVSWTDVVTPGRVLTLTEVVAREKLTPEDLRKAGARSDVIDRVFATVNSGANLQAAAERQRITAALKNAGVSDEEIRRQLAAGLRSRFGANGPGGSPPPPPSPPTPPPAPAPPPPPPPKPPGPTPDTIRGIIGSNARAEEVRLKFVAEGDRVNQATADLSRVNYAIGESMDREAKLLSKLNTRLDDDKRAKLNRDLEKLREKRQADYKEQDRLKQLADTNPTAVRIRSQEMLRQADPAQTKFNDYEGQFNYPAGKRAMRDAVEFVTAITNREVAPASITIELNKTGRAWARPATMVASLRDEPGYITAIETAVHEFGHLIEHGQPSTWEAVKAFLVMRTRGETPKPMSDFGSWFDPGELGRDDDFAKGIGALRGRYAGKVYARGEKHTGADPEKAALSEIVSLGLEELVHRAANFAKNDPEYFKLMVMILNGDFANAGTN